MGLPLANLSFLGGDENDAVGTTGTIDSCGGDVFQYFYTLDVVGIDGGQGIQTSFNGTDTRGVIGCILEIDKAVDHVERFVGGVDRVTATNADVTVGARLSAAGCHVESSHLSSQSTIEGGGNGFLKDIGFDSGHATCQLVTLLCAVAHHDDFVQFA